MKKQNPISKNTSNDSHHSIGQKIRPDYLKLKLNIPFIFEFIALWIKNKPKN